MERRFGLSDRPSVLYVEYPYSEWDGEGIESRQRHFDSMYKVLGEFSDLLQNAPAEVLKSRKPHKGISKMNSFEICFPGIHPENSLFLRFTHALISDSEADRYTIGMQHFDKCLIVSERDVPMSSIKRDESVPAWPPKNRTVSSGLLDNEAGPRQIEQYAGIVAYTHQALSQGCAFISERIVSV